MEELMIDSDTDDLEAEETVVVPIEAGNNGKNKKQHRKKMTDFFQSKK